MIAARPSTAWPFTATSLEPSSTPAKAAGTACTHAAVRTGRAKGAGRGRTHRVPKAKDDAVLGEIRAESVVRVLDELHDQRAGRVGIQRVEPVEPAAAGDNVRRPGRRRRRCCDDPCGGSGARVHLARPITMMTSGRWEA